MKREKLGSPEAACIGSETEARGESVPSLTARVQQKRGVMLRTVQEKPQSLVQQHRRGATLTAFSSIQTVSTLAI